MHREVGHLMSIFAPTDLRFEDYTKFATNQDTVAQGTFWELFPGFIASKHRHRVAYHMYGKHWVSIRKAFSELWERVFNDLSFKDLFFKLMRQQTWRVFPVRTGHLFDYVHRTMWLDISSDYNSRHQIRMSFLWPADRPYPIPKRVAHSGEEGHAQLPLLGIMYPPPNAQFLRIGPRGGRIYRLNDPQARNDPLQTINYEVSRELLDVTRCIFQGTRAIYHMRKQGYKPGFVQVSQAGAKTEYFVPANPNGPYTGP